MLVYSLPVFAQNVKIEQKYFLDQNNSYYIDNIYENKDIFIDIKPQNTTFGLRNETVWLYLKIENQTSEFKSNVIEFSYPLLDYIYVLKYKDGEIVDKYLTGDLTPFNSRKVNSHTFVIIDSLASKQIHEYIFKVNSQGALNVGMNFITHKEYDNKSTKENLLLGIYYGAVIIMLLYNLVLYFIIKEKIYLDYVTFHFAYLFLQLGLNGLSFQYFWPSLPEINLYFIPFMLALSLYFAMKFTISFLSLENYQKIYEIFKIIMIFCIAIMILTFLTPYWFIIKIIAGLFIIVVFLVFTTSIYILFVENSVSAKFYITAWSLLLVGILLTELQNLGLIPMNDISLYGTQIGAFIELALLSVALAYRYNTLYIKLISTESDLRSLNIDLEKKVLQRTKDQDQLLSLFDKGEVCLFKWRNDENWSIDYVSKNTSPIFGYTQKEFLDKNFNFKDIISDDNLDSVVDELKDAIDNKIDFFVNKPYKIISKSGYIKWLLSNILIVRNHKDQIKYFLGYIVDVTDLKEYENGLEDKIQKTIDETKQKEKLLQQQSKLTSMGEMIRNIAHQWRQPLSQINSSVQLLDLLIYKKDIKDAQIEEKLSEIESLTKYMSNTIDDFQSFFKSDKEQELFILQNIIQNTISIIQGTLTAKNIKLEFLSNETYQYNGYPHELQHVVLIIINNSIDALVENKTKNPKISINVIEHSNFYQISICDNAGGINEKIIDKIFEPYFTTKHKSQGTGLGLYISKMIIQDGMNGSLDVQNKNDGACFNISLPRKQNNEK